METVKIDITQTISLSDIHYDDKECPISFKGNVYHKRVQLRPMNEEIHPKIYTEVKQNKMISHNYGHGPSGWSLLFGSVYRSIEYFENNFIHSKKLDFESFKENEEITVIGMGCIGLVTTLTLHYKGYKKIKLIGEEKDMLASHIAGGLINHVVMKNLDEKVKTSINSLFYDSFVIYKSIVENTHPFFDNLKDCVRWVKFYTDDPVTDGVGLTTLYDLKLLERPVKATLLFGDKDKPLKHDDFWIAKTFLVSVEKFLAKAYDEIKRFGIKTELKKISSFSEIKSNYIFNCTGLGSYYLNNDKTMYPACGHGFILKNQPNERNFDFILIIHGIPGLEKSEHQGTLYFMPKEDNLFIGGTYLNNYYGDDDEVNKKQWASLMKRARYLFHGIHPDSKDHLRRFKSLDIEGKYVTPKF